MKYRKIIASIVIIITIFFVFSPMCFAAKDDTPDFKKMIKKEGGSLFEKIIAKTIRRNRPNSLWICNKR